MTIRVELEDGTAYEDTSPNRLSLAALKGRKVHDVTESEDGIVLETCSGIFEIQFTADMNFEIEFNCVKKLVKVEAQNEDRNK